MIDFDQVVQMIEARSTAAHKAAATDITGCKQVLADEYDDLLLQINVRRQNFEKPMDTE